MCVRNAQLISGCRCLVAGDSHDLDAAFRVCQIWFSNSSQPEVNTALASLFQAVPSNKFLCLVYQIASRLGAPSEQGGRIPGAVPAWEQ